jgi:hypothetical protein
MNFQNTKNWVQLEKEELIVQCGIQMYNILHQCTKLYTNVQHGIRIYNILYECTTWYTNLQHCIPTYGQQVTLIYNMVYTNVQHGVRIYNMVYKFCNIVYIWITGYTNIQHGIKIYNIVYLWITYNMVYHCISCKTNVKLSIILKQ